MIYNAAPKGKIQFKTQKAAQTHLFPHAHKHNLRCPTPHIIQEAQESISGVCAQKDTHTRVILCYANGDLNIQAAVLGEGRIDGQGTELPRVPQQHWLNSNNKHRP